MSQGEKNISGLGEGEIISFNGGIEAYLADDSKGPPRRLDEYSQDEIAALSTEELLALHEREKEFALPTTDSADPEGTKIVMLPKEETRVLSEKRIATDIIYPQRKK